MKFEFYNANPLGRRVNDCTVRAISLAVGITWDQAFDELSQVAQKQAIMPDEVEYIDEYLQSRFERVCDCRGRQITVGEFAEKHPKGTYLITMSGHITCCVDGCIYDTFDPSDRYLWDAYRV